MTKNNSPQIPFVLNIYKPARIGSFDVVRDIKRMLKKDFGKIGHFGTLDPFASGLLLIGVGGAQRLNDYIHDQYPKTYLCIGKLGKQTDTQDYTGKELNSDDSDYLKKVISSFDLEFLQKHLSAKFLGPYMQAPPAFSAAKFQGKPLHEWARAGVVIKKEPVERYIHKLKIIKYSFPYLIFETEVSSGTYIRVLFEDLCRELGTFGHLISLVRTKVGHFDFKNSIHTKKIHSLDELLSHQIPVTTALPLKKIILSEQEEMSFKNGAFIQREDLDEKVWMLNQKSQVLGLAKKVENDYRPVINFAHTLL